MNSFCQPYWNLFRLLHHRWSPDVKVTSSVAVAVGHRKCGIIHTTQYFRGDKGIRVGTGIAAARDNSNPPAAPKRCKLCMCIHFLYSKGVSIYALSKKMDNLTPPAPLSIRKFSWFPTSANVLSCPHDASGSELESKLGSKLAMQCGTSPRHFWHFLFLLPAWCPRPCPFPGCKLWCGSLARTTIMKGMPSSLVRDLSMGEADDVRHNFMPWPHVNKEKKLRRIESCRFSIF